MSAMNEAIGSTLAARELAEKVAAAREEQRAVCAATLRDIDPSYANNDRGQQHFAVAVVETAELASTPLADTITSLRADLVNAARVAEQLTQERDEARNARHLLAWDVVTAKEEVERVSSVLGAATIRLEEAQAELAAEAALASALQDELNSTRTAHAATVAWVVAVRDELLTPLAQVSTGWGATADGFGQATVKILVALEVKPEPLPSQVKEAITDFYEKRVKP